MILCELGQVRKEATAADDSCAEVWLIWPPPNLYFSMTYTIISLTATIGATMLSANIPHLYTRNGIYYYRNNSVWKSLRTRCKREAFRKLRHYCIHRMSYHHGFIIYFSVKKECKCRTIVDINLVN